MTDCLVLQRIEQESASRDEKLMSWTTNPGIPWAPLVCGEILSVTSLMRRNQRWSLDRSHPPSEAFDVLGGLSERDGLEYLLEYRQSRETKGISPPVHTLSDVRKTPSS